MQSESRPLIIALGTFFMLTCASAGYLVLEVADLDPFGDGRYALQARFVSASGLRPGAHVELSGVRVGQVRSIVLEPERYYARVELRIDAGVEISEDAIASIRTAGIIGDKFVGISQGGSDRMLEHGMEIEETEPSINLEELLSKYVFESEAR